MPDKVVIHKSKNNQWYITLEASNGQVRLTSETYLTKWNCRRSARKLSKLFSLIVVERL